MFGVVRRSNLLGHDSSLRVLPLVVGLMIYLLTLTLSGWFVAEHTASQWQRTLSGSLTVQVPHRKEVTAVVKYLRATPHIRALRVLSAQENRRMLAPLLGKDFDISNLPLPTLIDVTLNPGETVDALALEKGLRVTVSPHIAVDDHRFWRGQLRTGRSVMTTMATLVVGIVTLTTLLMVVFSVYGALKTHKHVVGILRMIGSSDAYIMRHFLWLVSQSTVLACVLGIVAGLLTFVLLGYLFHMDMALIGDILRARWEIFASIPLFYILVSLSTAYKTVDYSLSHYL